MERQFACNFLGNEWLSKENIRLLDGPAQSPVFNPIENLWNDVKTKIARKTFKKFGDTSAGLEEAWYSIVK